MQRCSSAPRGACVCVLGFQCPVEPQFEILFGQIFGVIPTVPEKSLEMTRPTSFLNHPTRFFRANFRANFGRRERASGHRVKLITHELSILRENERLHV
jgi:hypothetical protein